MRYPLGYVPDAAKGAGDKPDHDAGEALRAAPPPPASASNRNLVVSVLDQGPLGSCVANAGFQAIRASHVKQGIVSPKLGSRLLGYYLARGVDGTQDQDAGTQIRSFFGALNKLGFCAEDAYPYDVDKFADMPPAEVLQRAFDQRAPTVYKRITSTGYTRVDDVKRAIAAGYLVCFGTDVSVPFCNGEFDPTKAVDPPSGLDKIAGGHAMALAEYDGDNFGIPQSWGETFGVRGWIKFSADYIAWSSSRDFWIVEHAPLYSEGIR